MNVPSPPAPKDPKPLPAVALSITLPQSLLSYIIGESERTKRSRSGVIADLCREGLSRRKERSTKTQ